MLYKNQNLPKGGKMHMKITIGAGKVILTL